MNVWGMIFSFTIPGIIIGIMATLSLQQEIKKNKKNKNHKRGVIK